MAGKMARALRNGPLAGRHSPPPVPPPLARPAGGPRQPLAPVPRPGSLFGCCPSSPVEAAAAPAASLFTDASGEPTMSCQALVGAGGKERSGCPCNTLAASQTFLRPAVNTPPTPALIPFHPQPADSCDPTVDGPAAKRPCLGTTGGRGWGAGLSGWGASASAASCASDDSDGEEAVSRKRPTPQKRAAPSSSGAAVSVRAQPAPVFSLAARAAAVPAAPRLVAQHPPPTWAQASLQAGMQASTQRGGCTVLAGAAAEAQMAAGAEDDQVGAGCVEMGGTVVMAQQSCKIAARGSLSSNCQRSTAPAHLFPIRLSAGGCQGAQSGQRC